MKNQNDLIVAGAIVLVCIGVSLVFMLQRREPFRPAAPPQVVTTDAVPAGASVVYSNSLPGAQDRSAAPAGGGAAGGTGRGGGPRIAGAAGG